METALDILSWASLISGTVLVLIGGIGLIRLPDIFARIHGASLIDTMGLGFILFGLILQAGLTIVAIKLIMIFAFIFLTSPTATHALASAALEEGLNPLLGSGDDGPNKKDPSKKEPDPSKI